VRAAEIRRPTDDQWIVAQRIHKHEFVVDVAVTVERVRPFRQEIGEGAFAEVPAGGEDHVPVVADRLLLAERVVLDDVSKHIIVRA
jgi:hypothetical protein